MPNSEQINDYLAPGGLSSVAVVRDNVTTGATELLGPGGVIQAAHYARMNCLDSNGDIAPTAIATSLATTAGTFTTELVFPSAESVIADTVGGVADWANNGFVIPSGFRYCRISYSIAFGVDAGDRVSSAAGWRGCRIKNSSDGNYGNQRITSVSGYATTNTQYTTPWIEILEAGDPSISAPNSIGVGDIVKLYPAQTSGITLNAASDVASSWFHIEFSN